GKFLACNGIPVGLWDLSQHQPRQLSELRGTSPVGALAFAPDGRTLATAGSDDIVQLWSLEGGAVKSGKTLKSTLGGMRILQFAPDGRTLISGHEWRANMPTVCLWDIPSGSGTPRATLASGSIYSLSFAGDSKRVALTTHEGLFLLDAKKPDTRKL